MVVVVAVVMVVELTVVRLLVVMVVVDLECVKTARYQERVFCVGGSLAHGRLVLPARPDFLAAGPEFA